MKLLIAVILSSAILTSSTFAGPTSHNSTSNTQDLSNQDQPASVNDNTALLRQNNITSTGATVPHPGASQSGGPTALDHDIERLNDRIEHSICTGC